jgi:hypothetical protein
VTVKARIEELILVRGIATTRSSGQYSNDSEHVEAIILEMGSTTRRHHCGAVIRSMGRHHRAFGRS